MRMKAGKRLGAFARPEKANRPVDIGVNAYVQRRPPFFLPIKSRRALPGAVQEGELMERRMMTELRRMAYKLQSLLLRIIERESSCITAF